jgi:hypothetical protein
MSYTWTQYDLFGIDMRTDEKLRLRNILDVNLPTKRTYETNISLLNAFNNNI